MEEEQISELWLLAPELTITQASLLLIGCEPQGEWSFVETMNAQNRPPSYDAAKAAIAGAVNQKLIKGRLQNTLINEGQNSYFAEPFELDAGASIVETDSLITWLRNKGFDKGYFFPKQRIQAAYLDTEHARYAPKLAAVVEAWEAFDEKDISTGTVKQKLEKWLRLNAARFGFTDENGSPQENVIKDLAKVANWATRGGAPKQAEQEPDPDF